MHLSKQITVAVLYKLTSPISPKEIPLCKVLAKVYLKIP